MKRVTSAVFLILAVLLAAGNLADAAPDGGRRCKHKLQRKAWHNMSKREKADYIKAEKCLMKLPAKMGFVGTRTRFDELQAVHVMAGEIVHENGAFLPYHRWFMHVHEKMLRDECGYKGAQPYWDEKRDAGNVNASVINDPETGFGGNGVAPDFCIQDGPFVGYINGLGPLKQVNDHCIYRSHNNEASWWMSQEFVNYCYQFNDYASAFWCLKGGPHAGGHAAIGGLVGDPYSSPGDPIFYLHHTFLDKVWWDWQAKNPKSRLYDMGGTNGNDPCLVFSPVDGWPSKPPISAWPNGRWSFKRVEDGLVPFPGFPGGLPEPFGCVNGTNVLPPWPQNPGDPGNITTLGHIMHMFNLVPDTTVREVMDIGNDKLCYEYV